MSVEINSFPYNMVYLSLFHFIFTSPCPHPCSLCSSQSDFFLLLFKILFIYSQADDEGETKRRRETLTCEININSLSLAPVLGPGNLGPTWDQPGNCPVTQASALTGNQTGNILVSGMVPNPLTHTTQRSFISCK